MSCLGVSWSNLSFLNVGLFVQEARRGLPYHLILCQSNMAVHVSRKRKVENSVDSDVVLLFNNLFINSVIFPH